MDFDHDHTNDGRQGYAKGLRWEIVQRSLGDR